MAIDPLANAKTIRSYEDAATAVGRLDASAKLMDDGLRELLVLRTVAAPTATTTKGMITLARSDGEGDAALAQFADALRTGAARARGGAPPSLASLHSLLGTPAPPEPSTELDELFRDARERTPPVLKAARAAHLIRESAAGETDELTRNKIALAVTLVLCVGGAITDAWLTLPLAALGASAADSDAMYADFFGALAREARAAEQGLAAVRELQLTDETRVRDTLGRAAYSALDVLALMRSELVITVPETARTLGQTHPTAGAAVARLVELGIAIEITGKARSRAFAYEGMFAAVRPS